MAIETTTVLAAYRVAVEYGLKLLALLLKLQPRLGAGSMTIVVEAAFHVALFHLHHLLLHGSMETVATLMIFFVILVAPHFLVAKLFLARELLVRCMLDVLEEFLGERFRVLK